MHDFAGVEGDDDGCTVFDDANDTDLGAVCAARGVCDADDDGGTDEAAEKYCTLCAFSSSVMSATTLESVV